jgi:Kef-type K+ transport system membrane component KefB
VVDRLTGVGRQLLLPVFFVVAGYQLDLAGIGLPGLGELAAILAVAVIAKAAGTYLAATLHRIPREEAATLAVLMNTRGLTEIVGLTIGLRTGILDQQLYSLLVVMALITTAMTGPLLSLIRRHAQRRGVPAQLGDADNTAARSTVRPDWRAVAMSD